MKFLYFLLFLLPQQGSTQELLWVKFVSENKRCSINQNYLRLNDEPIVRVEMFRVPEKGGSITDYYWIKHKYIYRFEFRTTELFLVKRYLKNEDVIWSLRIESIKFATIR